MSAPATMRAMVLERAGEDLVARDVPVGEPGPGEILLDVRACGLCRTDLHLRDGEVSAPRLPLIPGHQIVGVVRDLGAGSSRFRRGERVGVAWLGWACGECAQCRAGRENLCERARFTGRDRDGGFAEAAVADERFCFRIPDAYDDLAAAPLLCAGLIGFRALRLAGDPRVVGLYGFGSSAHLVAQLARWEGRRVFAFTRAGDRDGQAFALRLGADWAGDALGPPPEPLDAAIIFAAAGELVPVALGAVRPGGAVVCAGIHMSDIPALPYALLWGERSVRSVANLTRADGESFLALAPRVPVRTAVRGYPLEKANEALADLRAGRLEGSAVLSVRA